MAIKQFITLEGAEDVVANLKKISDAGEQALNTFRQSGQAFVPVDQFTNSLRQTSAAAEDTGTSMRGLVDVARLARPALEELGVSMVGFREISAVLTREGIPGLIAALGVGLATAAAKAADGVNNLQRQLNFLLGPAQGGKAFDVLKQSASELGSSLGAVQPALISIMDAIGNTSPFRTWDEASKTAFKGMPQDLDKAHAAIDAVGHQLEALGETAGEATPQVNKLFAELAKPDPKTGAAIGLTLQTFQQLQQSAPELAKILENAIGPSVFDRLKKGPIGFQEVLRDLAAMDIKVKLEPIPDTVAKSFENVKNSAEELLATLGKQADLGVLTGFLKDLNQGLKDTSTQLGDVSFDGLKKGIGDAETELSGLNQAFQSTGKALHDALAQPVVIAPQQQGLGIFDALAQNFQQSMDQLQSSAANVWPVIQGIFSDGVQQLQADLSGVSWESAWSGLAAAAQSAFDKIKSAWQAVVDFINNLQPNLSVGGGSTGGGFEIPSGGAAAGGLVIGSGTGTSDSILSWLSNFEYVMRSAAVKFYGVDFMHAINSMSLPKDFFRGFNLGGLVLPPFPSPPRFAQGGLAVAGNSRSRTLTLSVDGPAKLTFRGSSTTVDELERAADLHNLSRLGRAPGWVK